MQLLMMLNSQLLKIKKNKICCKYSLEILKIVIHNVKHYIDASKKET